MTDTDVRTKDPCRFCSERNKQCGGSCGVQPLKDTNYEKVLSDMKTHKELIEENTKLKEQLEVAEKMIELMADALIVNIDERKFNNDNIEITIYYFKQQALEQIKKVDE